MPFVDRVYEVLGWFDQGPQFAPELMVLYLDQPDTAGHVYGPYANEVRVMVSCGKNRAKISINDWSN